MLTQREAQLKRVFWLYTLVLVGISAMAWVTVTAAARHGLLYPQNSFLFSPASRFSDWTNFSVRVAHHGEPDVLSRRDLNINPYPYPLTSFYVYLLFVRAFHDSLRGYLVASVLIFLVIGLLYYARVREYVRWTSLAVATLATLLLAEPMYFLLDRGNIEFYIWLFVVIGAVAFTRHKPWIATAFFAVAAAMKLYPFLYLLLFIRRRQWRYLAAGTALTVALSIGSMYEIGPTIRSAMQETSRSGRFLRDQQIIPLNPSGTRFDHSLLGMSKAVRFHIDRLKGRVSGPFPPSYPRVVLAYTVVAPLLFIVLYLGRIIRLPLMNQFLAFTVLSLLLPYVSYEYTLIHVCTMLGAFVLYLVTDYRSNRSALSFRTVGMLMTSFAFLLAPLSFGPLTAAPALAKGLILLGMLVFTLAMPLGSSMFDDLPDNVASRVHALRVTG